MLVVYVSDQCPKCKLLCSYLSSLNIPHEKREARDFTYYLTSQGFRSLPILEIDGELYNFTSVNEVLFILKEKGLLNTD